MPVNGIELKEGQKWKTLSGRVATLEDNQGADSYIFRTVYEDGEWNTVTKDGKCWTSDYDSFLRELIYDPEQQVKEKLTMKFNPKPGDKIICNNGEEFICCTLDFLHAKDMYPSKPQAILGFDFVEETWQDWDEDGYASLAPEDDYDIREVIPQSSEVTDDKKEEVKEEPRYNLQEIKEAWDASGWVISTSAWEVFQKNLTQISSPEYQEYLRLKAIYE